jgi:hypothetical protein
MSTEDERSVPADLFSAPPADSRRGLPTTGTYRYAAAGAGGAGRQFVPAAPAYTPMPATQGPKRPGLARRILSYVAVAFGALIILGSLLEFASSRNDSASGSYRGGQVLGLVLAIAMIYGGSQEIRSNHLERRRYLPWITAFMGAMLVLAVVAILALRPPYPASVQANFLNGCEARGGDAGQCGCALKWFESHKSLSEFVAIDAEARATGRVPAHVTTGIASSCSH